MLIPKKQRARPMSEINVVPYIDVMLVLLVIFMITAPMLTQGVTVDLPKAASESVTASDREPIIVSVNRDGAYFLNTHPSPGMPLEAQQLMVQIAAELELAKQSRQSINVLVKGDQGVPYGKIIQVMSMIKRAGAEQVGLITDSSEMDEGDVG